MLHLQMNCVFCWSLVGNIQKICCVLLVRPRILHQNIFLGSCGLHGSLRIHLGIWLHSTGLCDIRLQFDWWILLIAVKWFLFLVGVYYRLTIHSTGENLLLISHL